MGRFGVGQAVRRTEDTRLLTGQGRYMDDIDVPGQARAFFVRSPHAHAEIERIDTAAAAQAPGVVGVLTAAEYRAAGYGPLPCEVAITNIDGSARADPPRWPLAGDRVRYVGDSVALVVAETLAAAKDAAERIEIAYQPLPAVSDTAAALGPDAPRIWDEAPGNLCFDYEVGDKAATEAAFAAAAHVSCIDIVNNRVIVNSMEPRGAIAECTAEGRFVFHVSSQGVHMFRDWLCDSVLHIPRERLRVLTPDVGGAFGMKILLYPEYPVLLLAAERLGRPVKWIPDRSDAFMTDVHGRDNVTHAELAMDSQGRFLGARVVTIANMGAYLSTFGPYIPTYDGAPLLASVYDNPAIYAVAKGVFTNTVPVDAYRGPGRSEANYTIERLVEAAARDLGVGQAELRRRNFIPPEKMPYKTALVHTYDSGAFAHVMDKAMERAEWSGFEARRAAARARGKLAGIGMSYYVEATGTLPEGDVGLDEMDHELQVPVSGQSGVEALLGDSAIVRVTGEGGVEVVSGTQTNGQGHATAFAQIVSDSLGVPFESITLVQGDSDDIAMGQGTGGSRTVIYGGAAMIDAADKVIERGKVQAAEMMEAAAADIEYAEGQFTIAGTDRRVGIFEVAADASRGEGGLEAEGGYLPEVGKGRSFPNGCHVCELEIDGDTGLVEIVRYTIVDDFGKMINPLLVAGQVHGGTAQGIGQAMLEGAVYEPDSGQLLSGSFLDYCMPRADNLPSYAFFTDDSSPCRNNPFGMKGCGEASSIGATPAVVNAALDALGPLGVRAIDMPLTPERVWRSIREATTPVQS